MYYNIIDVYGKTDGYKPNLVDFTLIMLVIKVDWHTEVSLMLASNYVQSFVWKCQSILNRSLTAMTNGQV